MSAQAQDGKISGTVKGNNDEPLGFVTVLVYDGDLFKYGGKTDEKGFFSIQPVLPGTYKVVAKYLKQTRTKESVQVTANQTKKVDFAFGDVTLEVVVIEEQAPFENTPIVGTTLTNDQVTQAATRNVNSLAALTAGVFQSDEGDGTLNIRGARNTGNVTYIDGVKVRGQSALPQASIAQYQVILGGTPAEYGDFTGGV
ncbi:MAG: carboxypeptidase regulatory-like domain-containing protein, partial [Bacteroidota bacterium]